jgi:hypothetical protein
MEGIRQEAEIDDEEVVGDWGLGDRFSIVENGVELEGEIIEIGNGVYTVRWNNGEVTEESDIDPASLRWFDKKASTSVPYAGEGKPTKDPQKKQTFNKEVKDETACEKVSQHTLERRALKGAQKKIVGETRFQVGDKIKTDDSTRGKILETLPMGMYKVKTQYGTHHLHESEIFLDTENEKISSKKVAYKVGDTVSYDDLEGKVIDVGDGWIDIEFPNGTKTTADEDDDRLVQLSSKKVDKETNPDKQAPEFMAATDRGEGSTFYGKDKIDEIKKKAVGYEFVDKDGKDLKVGDYVIISFEGSDEFARIQELKGTDAVIFGDQAGERKVPLNQLRKTGGLETDAEIKTNHFPTRLTYAEASKMVGDYQIQLRKILKNANVADEKGQYRESAQWDHEAKNLQKELNGWKKMAEDMKKRGLDKLEVKTAYFQNNDEGKENWFEEQVNG